jgi:hypothetical protein
MSKQKSRKARVVPARPINGLYPTLEGRIYQEDEKPFGQISEYFVADSDQGVADWDSVIDDYSVVKVE